MYFQRAIDTVLLTWSRQPRRKPLVLRGARQTGKSSSVRHLGKHFELYLELNLESRQDLALVRASRSPVELLVALKARHRVESFPERTLLFLDEIQESAEAIQWLRFFQEDHPELAVIAAGSLMEVRLQERGFSFPVGRVTFRWLHPVSFLESLRAAGEVVLADLLVEGVRAGAGTPPALHLQALEALRSYLLVGGMPEAVSRWMETRNPATVREVQMDLLQALSEDIQKYRGPAAVADLEAAFENLRHHVGLRFRYENFAPGFKSRSMRAALTMLESAMLIRRVWPTSSLELPLATRPKSAPKLLPLDIGLALAMVGTSFDDLRRLPLERLLDGRVAEMFVGQQLLTRAATDRDPLHFWVSESAQASAETDFLIPGDGFPVPVEVKSGRAGSLRSLHQFLWRSGHRLGVRFHAGLAADERLGVEMQDGRLDYRLLSVPLYLAEEVDTVLASAGSG